MMSFLDVTTTPNHFPGQQMKKLYLFKKFQKRIKKEKKKILKKKNRRN